MHPPLLIYPVRSQGGIDCCRAMLLVRQPGLPQPEGSRPGRAPGCAGPPELCLEPRGALPLWPQRLGPGSSCWASDLAGSLGSEVCPVADSDLLSPLHQERLHGCVHLLQPHSRNLLPAAGHGGTELWLPEPAGRCLQPPGQSQAEAAEAWGEPALKCGSLRTPADDSQVNPQQRKLCLAKWKSPSVLLSLE